MLRQDKEMSYDRTAAALSAGTWGVLSTFDGESSYGVPVNYVYSHAERAIFIHCALKGKKLDNIKYNNRVSFAVVLSERIVPEKFTTLYESAIASGRASIVENEDEKIKRLRQLCEALAPGNASADYITKYLPAAEVLRIDIDDMSGKKNAD